EPAAERCRRSSRHLQILKTVSRYARIDEDALPDRLAVGHPPIGFVPDLADGHQLLQAGRTVDEHAVKAALEYQCEHALDRHDHAKIFREGLVSGEREQRKARREDRQLSGRKAFLVEQARDAACTSELDDERAKAARRSTKRKRSRHGGLAHTALADHELKRHVHRSGERARHISRWQSGTARSDSSGMSRVFSPPAYVCAIALAAMSIVTACDRPRQAGEARPAARAPLVVLGLDAGTWDLLDPWIERGLLPNLARLRDGGAHGVLRSTQPSNSPVIWTSIATGKVPEKTGITWFVRFPNGPGKPVPVDRRELKTSTLWNMMGRERIDVAVLGWYVTWPAEHVNGRLLTDLAHFGNIEASRWPPSYLW